MHCYCFTFRVQNARGKGPESPHSTPEREAIWDRDGSGGPLASGRTKDKDDGNHHVDGEV